MPTEDDKLIEEVVMIGNNGSGDGTPDPEPEPTPLHTFTITAEAGRGVIGYWDGRVGSINNRDYTTPNGSTARIRQMMMSDANFGTNELRFLIRQDGLGVGDTEQFPVRLVCMSGGNEVVSVLKSPLEIRSYGQGIGMDYRLQSGTLSNVFADNNEITIQLWYE